VQAWFKPSAYAIILLRAEGYPCVFYGDLFGMPNDGDIPPVRELPVLMEARRRFAYGEQHDYFDSPDIIGWTREGDPERETSGCAVVLTDKVGSEKTMYVGSRHAGERWICVMGEENAVEVDGEGNATFQVGDGRCSVYLPESAAKILKSDYRAVLRHAKTAVDPQPREGESADEPLGDLDENPDAGITVDGQPSEQANQD
jgi:alpha-amylase